MEKNRVEVMIGGVNYALVSEDETEYIKKVADLVDKKMEEIGSMQSSLNSTKKAVLTAVNIADDFLKRSTQVRNVVNENEQLKKRIAELEKQTKYKK